MSEITFPQNCKLYLKDKILIIWFLTKSSCVKKRKDRPFFLSLSDLRKYVKNSDRLNFSFDENNIIDPRYRRDEKGDCYYFGLYLTEPHLSR